MGWMNSRPKIAKGPRSPMVKSVRKVQRKLVHHNSHEQRHNFDKKVSASASFIERLASGDMSLVQDGSVVVSEHQKRALRSNPNANTTLSKKQQKRLQRRAKFTAAYIDEVQGMNKMSD